MYWSDRGDDKRPGGSSHNHLESACAVSLEIVRSEGSGGEGVGVLRPAVSLAGGLLSFREVREG